MQASYAGPLASYNSLQDEHLAEYFSSPGRIRHLRRMGLVTRDGRIVSEGNVRRNAARKEHKVRSKDLLADAIVSNAIEIERKRRAALKKKLEFLAKIELVERVKSQKSHPLGVQEFNPYVLHPIPSPPPRLSATFNSHSDKLGLSTDQIFEMRKLVGEITKERAIRIKKKHPYGDLSSLSRSTTPSQMAPRPPSVPRPHTSMQNGSRRLQLTHQSGRPRTAPVNGPKTHTPYPNRSQPVRSEAQITLSYTGKGLHLEGCTDSGSSEVIVLQQHCGGNTVQLYKGRVRPREHFTFGSKRHLNMPFGLTMYLDGMMDSRLSACCEYRHQCGRLLGSKSAHFRLIHVEGGRPCYKCIAERERSERKESRQKSIDEAVNSSPSVEIENELEQLLMRNGITNSSDHTYKSNSSTNTLQTQSGIIETPQKSSYTQEQDSLESGHNIVDNEVQDIEVQSTDWSDHSEEELAKLASQSSISTQQSSHSERAPSISVHQNRGSQSSISTQRSSPLSEKAPSISDRHSRSSTHSRSDSSSSSSPSSRPITSHERPKYPTLASEPSSIAAADGVLQDVAAALKNSVQEEEEDYDYTDDVFEEPDESNGDNRELSAEPEAVQKSDSVSSSRGKSPIQSETESNTQSPSHEHSEVLTGDIIERKASLALTLSAPSESALERDKESMSIPHILSEEHTFDQTPSFVITPSTPEESQPTNKIEDLGLIERDNSDTKVEAVEGETSSPSMQELNDQPNPLPIESPPLELEPKEDSPLQSSESSPTHKQSETGDMNQEPDITPSNLSPSLTLEEATKVLEKTPSATSLGSTLDQASEYSSTVILSEADDHDQDIPMLERRISELSNKAAQLSASPSLAEYSASQLELIKESPGNYQDSANPEREQDSQHKHDSTIPELDQDTVSPEADQDSTSPEYKQDSAQSDGSKSNSTLSKQEFSEPVTNVVSRTSLNSRYSNDSVFEADNSQVLSSSSIGDHSSISSSLTSISDSPTSP